MNAPSSDPEQKPWREFVQWPALRTCTAIAKKAFQPRCSGAPRGAPIAQLTSEDMADRIGCHKDTVENAENETSSLEAVTLLNIAYIYG